MPQAARIDRDQQGLRRFVGRPKFDRVSVDAPAVRKDLTEAVQVAAQAATTFGVCCIRVEECGQSIAGDGASLNHQITEDGHGPF